MAVNGKDDRLTPGDFLTLARTIELPLARAEEAMASVAAAMREAVTVLSLPGFACDRANARLAEERVKVIVVERSDAFT